MTYLAALQGHPDAARTILQKGPQGNRNVCPSELPPVTQYQSVTVLFVPRDKAQAILPMLVRKSVVPRMGYSAYPAGGFEVARNFGARRFVCSDGQFRRFKSLHDHLLIFDSARRVNALQATSPSDLAGSVSPGQHRPLRFCGCGPKIPW